MNDNSQQNHSTGPCGDLCEADRKAALDIFGKLLMEVRDNTIRHWDRICADKTKYAPWDRLTRKFPDLDERTREIIGNALPHIVDYYIYRLLAGIDANEAVRVSVITEAITVTNIARVSWGLPAEPAGDDGWLQRFSKERFEQPY